MFTRSIKSRRKKMQTFQHVLFQNVINNFSKEEAKKKCYKHKEHMMRKSILVRELGRLYAMAFEIRAERTKTIKWKFRKREFQGKTVGNKTLPWQETMGGGVDFTWQGCRIISPFRISVFVLNSFILYSYSIIHSSNIIGYLLCARLSYLALGILCSQGIYDTVQQTNNHIFIQVN